MTPRGMSPNNCSRSPSDCSRRSEFGKSFPGIAYDEAAIQGTKQKSGLSNSSPENRHSKLVAFDILVSLNQPFATERDVPNPVVRTSGVPTAGN